jgi:pyrroloquinoline quinone (PQQ) biosynthesis protein C
MVEISNEAIYKQLKDNLSNLLVEEKQADTERIVRADKIEKIKVAVEAFAATLNKELFSNSKGTKLTDEFDYPKNKTWKERIIAYMKYYNKAVSISEIVAGLKSFETEYNADKLHAAISNQISTMVKKEYVQTYKPKKMKGYYYASPSWFDNEGHLLEEHKPLENEKSLW